MDVYKGIEFHNWVYKYDISDKVLLQAVEEMNNGAYDANLGGGVYKKRIPLKNKGKSGGARAILAFKLNERAFFIYGFAKNKQDNINEKELKALKKLAKVYLQATNETLIKAITHGNLIKVK